MFYLRKVLNFDRFEDPLQTLKWCSLFVFFSSAITFISIKYSFPSLVREQEEILLRHWNINQNNFEEKIRQIYFSLRTIGRLPGVAKISKHAENLNAFENRAIQELYNNLMTSVSVSELYIVPINFNPNQIDPKTNKLMEPAITYDHFIIGKTADIEKSENSNVPEIEDYEYQLMFEQLAHLKKNYSKQLDTEFNSIPLISGREVITCDNSRFSASKPNDRDRSGLLFSVPYYSESGDLKGMVTAVVLTANLLKYIKADSYETFELTNLDGSFQTQIQGSKIKNGEVDMLSWKNSLFENDKNFDLSWILVSKRSRNSIYESEKFFYYKTIHFGIFILTFLAQLALAYVFYREKRHSQSLKTALELQSQELELKHKSLVHKDKLASLGEMSAGVAHEINNPLAVIVGTIPLLKKYKNDELKFEEKSQVLLKSAARIEKIVKGLKKFSRTSTSELHKIHLLLEIINEAVLITEAKLKRHFITIKVNVDSNIKILCDDIEIEQVIVNLINNAADAIKDKNEKWIEIRTQIENEFVVLQIIDSGLGISPEVESKLFQPFFTTKIVGKGTGLGLSISKGIIEEHKGALSINRNIKNTCFEIKIPLYVENPETDKKVA